MQPKTSIPIYLWAKVDLGGSTRAISKAKTKYIYIHLSLLFLDAMVCGLTNNIPDSRGPGCGCEATGHDRSTRE